MASLQPATARRQAATRRFHRGEFVILNVRSLRLLLASRVFTMIRIAVATSLVGLALGCSHDSEPTQTDRARSQPAAPSPTNLTTNYLPNSVQIHPNVISGGLPDGDAAFQELASLGVRTVISVDGAKPDVETAAKYGLRYVHLPHGYDGIPDDRVQELAKAVRDLDGSIYIHCHHGKHRSPAAASVACVAAGLIPRSEAIAVLNLAGTSPNYRGLYQSVANVQPLDKALLDELDVEFRETIEVPPLAQAMVAMEHTHDHLKKIAEAGWCAPTDHPDLEPAHEALLLQEHFSELLRTSEVQQQADGFRRYLRDSEAAAHELESQLRVWHPAESKSNPPEILGRLADRISTNCKGCHQRYRDTPLGEK